MKYTDAEIAQGIAAIQASGKYQSLCPETIARVYRDACARYRTAKEVDKATRTRLHRMTAAFVSSSELRAARADLIRDEWDTDTALSQALRHHASTRERSVAMDALYEQVFAIVGTPTRILDLACGLNPLYLGARGLSVVGWDIHGGLIALINECAALKGWDVQAECRDVLMEPLRLPEGPFTLALMMKLLPLLETECAGAAARLMSAVPATYSLVTFPTRTLGGRSVGMEAHYDAWFARICPASCTVVARFTVADELCFVVRNHD